MSKKHDEVYDTSFDGYSPRVHCIERTDFSDFIEEPNPILPEGVELHISNASSVAKLGTEGEVAGYCTRAPARQIIYRWGRATEFFNRRRDRKFFLREFSASRLDPWCGPEGPGKQYLVIWDRGDGHQMIAYHLAAQGSAPLVNTEAVAEAIFFGEEPPPTPPVEFEEGLTGLIEEGEQPDPSYDASYILDERGEVPRRLVRYPDFDLNDPIVRAFVEARNAFFKENPERKFCLTEFDERIGNPWIGAEGEGYRFTIIERRHDVIDFIAQQVLSPVPLENEEEVAKAAFFDTERSW